MHSPLPPPFPPAFLEKAVELIKHDPEEPMEVLNGFSCYSGVRISLNEISVNESTLKSISIKRRLTIRAVYAMLKI
jgi:hypothetical protein